MSQVSGHQESRGHTGWSASYPERTYLPCERGLEISRADIDP